MAFHSTYEWRCDRCDHSEPTGSDKNPLPAHWEAVHRHSSGTSRAEFYQLCAACSDALDVWLGRERIATEGDR